MFQLPLFGKHKNPRTNEPKNFLRGDPEGEDGKGRRERKKKEPEKPWTLKDRLIVVGVLLATVLLAGYFWFKGNNKLPEIKFQAPSFEEKIILE
ncbi:MAG: hypothetical protein AAB599_00095 [Patescibacteria group bacterium]